jgi:hypothetical protein
MTDPKKDMYDGMGCMFVLFGLAALLVAFGYYLR